MLKDNVFFILLDIKEIMLYSIELVIWILNNYNKVLNKIDFDKIINN